MDGGSDRLARLIEARGSGRVAALLNEQRTDTLQPAALGWLKSWGPAGLVPKLQACGCARGRCEICN